MDTEYADQVKQFVRAATDESPGPVEGPFLLAKRMLARDPALAKADVYTALVLGDVETIRRQVERDPRWVSQKGGPQPRREPLLYVCGLSLLLGYRLWKHRQSLGRLSVARPARTDGA